MKISHFDFFAFPKSVGRGGLKGLEIALEGAAGPYNARTVRHWYLKDAWVGA